MSRTLLSNVFSMPTCSALEYRYVLSPSESGSLRVALYFVVKSYSDYGNDDTVRAALESVRGAFSPQFKLEPPPRHHRHIIDAPTLGMPILELRRRETTIEPVYGYVPAQPFYLIDHNLGDGSGWANFWDPLPKVTSPVEISFLFKQTNLTREEHYDCSANISELYRISEARIQPNILGVDTHYPADTNARMAYESWDGLLRKLQRCFLVRVAIRGPITLTSPLAGRLCTALSRSAERVTTDAELTVDPPRSDPQALCASESFTWLEIYPWGGHYLWQPDHFDVAPHSLRRFPYLFSLDDAASIAMLPVPDERGAVGFPIGRRSDERRQPVANDGALDIGLGYFRHHGEAGDPAGMSLADLNRHTLVVGASGSGKTTTVMTILTRLWREHDVPFLVIEPTKREYRSLLNVDGMDDLHVLTIGREDLCTFRLNPLQPPKGIRLENHMSSLMAMFKLALPLFYPIPPLLEAALESAFHEAGWRYDDADSADLIAPSLRDVARWFDVVFKDAEYVGEALNIGAAMQVRLNSMLRGSRGRVLDTVQSDKFSKLLDKPVVVELDSVDDADDKSLFAAIFLGQIRAACQDRGSGHTLSHVTVIEEAHRVLPNSGLGSNDGDSIRQQSVDAYCNAIAELRALGEGFIISSQSPRRLAPAAIANAGSRILHRMESAEDRDTILSDFDLIEVDRPIASRLDVGEAFFRSVAMDEAELIKVVPVPGVDSAAPPEDDEIKIHMQPFSENSERSLPYPMCTRDVCVAGCIPETRREGESLATAMGATATQAWDESESLQEALVAAAEVMLRETDDRIVAYCGASHLNAQQGVFRGKSVKLMRSRVMLSMGLSPDQARA